MTQKRNFQNITQISQQEVECWLVNKYSWMRSRYSSVFRSRHKSCFGIIATQNGRIFKQIMCMALLVVRSVRQCQSADDTQTSLFHSLNNICKIASVFGPSVFRLQKKLISLVHYKFMNSLCFSSKISCLLRHPVFPVALTKGA